MGDKSEIGWTDATLNPIVGCSKVSPGCDGCYAIGVVHRAMSPQHVGLTVHTPSGSDWTGEVREVPHMLDQALRWKKPRRVFLNSLSDLFHPNVSDHYIARVFAVMSLTPQHTYQILTKRPARMPGLLGSTRFWQDVSAWRDVYTPASVPRYSLPILPVGNGSLTNVHLGTSIESAKYLFRVDPLQKTPAALRFLSLEPLLGRVTLGPEHLAGIGWVIAGGESGPGARPMHPDWAREIRDVCDLAAVPFFFKQWGAWAPTSSARPAKDPKTIAVHPAGMTALRPDNPFDPFAAGHPNWVAMRNVGAKKAGNVLDGRVHEAFPA